MVLDITFAKKYDVKMICFCINDPQSYQLSCEHWLTRNKPIAAHKIHNKEKYLNEIYVYTRYPPDAKVQCNPIFSVFYILQLMVEN